MRPFGFLRRRETGAPAEIDAGWLKAFLDVVPAVEAGMMAEAARNLNTVLGTSALAIVERGGAVTWADEAERDDDGVVREFAGMALVFGEIYKIDDDLVYPRPAAIVAPLGELAAFVAFPSATSVALLRLVARVSDALSDRLELAGINERRRKIEARIETMEAAFSLRDFGVWSASIAAMIRFDPESARELSFDLAEYLRYVFSLHGELTTLADEMRCVGQFLALERARLGGNWLTVTLDVEPGALSVLVPYFVLQPLAAAAVRQSVRNSSLHLTITAAVVASEVHVVLEASKPCIDIKVGHAELRRVDKRLQQAYGVEFALLVESRRKVSFKIPR